MSELVKNNLPLLQLLSTADRKRRKALLATLTRDEVDAIVEVLLNALAGECRHKLTPHCVKQCARYKKHLRALAYDQGLSWKKRRNLTQVGGGAWLIPLISAALSLLTK